MGLSRQIFVAFLVLVAAAELVGNAAAATYVVGDSLGWTVPPNAASYVTWASQHVFAVGDVLVFNFTTGFHSAARVTSGAYAGCSSNNPIALATLGPASFTLNSTGPDYYICTFGQHCSLGQRLAINVTTAAPPTPAPTPPPSVTPPPPAATPTPSIIPSPTPSTVPSPTPSSLVPSPTPSSLVPSPAPSSLVPSPAPSSLVPSPSPSPESAASPSPSGSGPMAPTPSSGGSASSPGPGGPTGDLTPPPPPGSSAIRASVGTPLALIASLLVALVM